MRQKHAAGNKYSVLKYWLIVDHFVVAMANLTIYVWDTQQDAHCEDQFQVLQGAFPVDYVALSKAMCVLLLAFLQIISALVQRT
jgi:hypothetical protein